jgi:hypothetical protein
MLSHLFSFEKFKPATAGRKIWGKPPETTQTEGANTVHSQYHHREF